MSEEEPTRMQQVAGMQFARQPMNMLERKRSRYVIYSARNCEHAQIFLPADLEQP
jgi:hypothetical protein